MLNNILEITHHLAFTGIAATITAGIFCVHSLIKSNQLKNKSIDINDKQVQQYIATISTIAAITGTVAAAIIIALIC